MMELLEEVRRLHAVNEPADNEIHDPKKRLEDREKVPPGNPWTKERTLAKCTRRDRQQR